MNYLELALRWILGLQLIFWGLNGFFNWLKLPPAPPVIEGFITACIESRFIMPTVKVFEIIFGLILLSGEGTPFGLIMLAPIIFVITGLHLIHNKKAWEVLLPISLPFILLIVLHYEAWLKLLT